MLLEINCLLKNCNTEAEKHFDCLQRIVISHQKTIWSFINVICFKQINQDAFVEDISEKMMLCLSEQEWSLLNEWKTFAIAKDSSDGNAMKSTLKTAMTKDKNETQTKASKNPRKVCSESENVKRLQNCYPD